MSLENNKKYGTYLSIQTNKDIFNGLKIRKELQKSAINYIRNGNKNFDIIDKLNNNYKIKFIRRSWEEYLFGRNSKKLSNYDYKLKLRLVPSIDDLIKYETIKYKSPLTHYSYLFPNGYDNFQGILEIDNHYFKYIIRIGINNDNNSIFYDVSLDNAK